MNEYLSKNLLELDEHNVRLHFLGDMSRLHPVLQDSFRKAEEEMKDNTGLTLNVAVNYGGRMELARAARLLAEDVQKGRISPSDITEDTLAGYLYTAPENDVDLLIRPGSTSGSAIFCSGRWPMPSSGIQTCAGLTLRRTLS